MRAASAGTKLRIDGQSALQVRNCEQKSVSLMEMFHAGCLSQQEAASCRAVEAQKFVQSSLKHGVGVSCHSRCWYACRPTHLPICAISTASPTCRMKVDFPAVAERRGCIAGCARAAQHNLTCGPHKSAKQQAVLN